MKYSKGKGYLDLRKGKRTSTWRYQFREYIGDKQVRRKVRIGTIEEYPTREAAWAAVDFLRYHGQIDTIERLMTRERRHLERKSLPRFSKDWFVSKVQEQNGRCAICQRMPKRLVPDHDHNDGSLRGLLCQTCNTGIGMLRDEPALIRAALLYMESYDKFITEEEAQAKPLPMTTQ